MARAREIKAERELDPSSIPAGTTPLKRTIVETTIGFDPRLHATYTSIDGEEYTFRTHDNKGKPIPSRELLALFLAFRETEAGGSASTVLDAFRVTIEDVSGKKVYPIEEKVFAAVETGEDTSQAFSLGE